MSGSTHKECYGTMFPDALHFTTNHPVRGKVFSYELDQAGGMMQSDRSTSFDIGQWDDCLACPEFEHCYKLCLGRLTLQAAIANE
jgi:hypothetical protein